MADIFDVDGPIQIAVSDTVESLSWNDLGHSPNNDKPQIDERFLYDVQSSDEEGDEPGEAVYNGSDVLLTFSIVKHTNAQIDELRRIARGLATGSAGGAAGTIGMALLGVPGTTEGAGAFGIRMTPILASKRQLIFGRCMMADRMREFNKGNSTTMFAFAIRALRDESGNFWTEVTTT